jgi:DNA-binding Lrp family transcriptional regulator
MFVHGIKMVSVADILRAISDKRALALLRIVARTKPNTIILISKTKLTRKQYYSRMSTLVRTGLVKRIKGKYAPIAFGKLIYYNALIIIDSLEMSNDLPAEERKKIIDSFIDNQKIKDVLVSSNRKFEFRGPYDVELLQQTQTRQLIQAFTDRKETGS